MVFDRSVETIRNQKFSDMILFFPVQQNKALHYIMATGMALSATNYRPKLSLSKAWNDKQ